MVSKPPKSPERNRKAFNDDTVPVYEMQFPELFVYWNKIFYFLCKEWDYIPFGR